MTDAASIYGDGYLAAGYAFRRPPVHAHIVRRIRQYLKLDGQLPRALDVGCGAGVSTAALLSVARTCVGVDPMAAMLTHSRAVAPEAFFAVASAEALPFPAGAFDLLTAAGSLNYTDLALALPEAARVLAIGGVMAICDYAAGSRFRRDAALERWYVGFRERYPAAPGYHVDFREVQYSRFGLKLAAYEQFEVPIPMTLAAYLAYVMTETRVALAMSRGSTEHAIRDWCRQTLDGVFAGDAEEVVFDAYVAYVRQTED